MITEREKLAHALNGARVDAIYDIQQELNEGYGNYLKLQAEFAEASAKLQKLRARYDDVCNAAQLVFNKALEEFDGS